MLLFIKFFSLWTNVRSVSVCQGAQTSVSAAPFSWRKDTRCFDFWLEKNWIHISSMGGYMATYVVCISNAYFLDVKEMVASSLLYFWRESPHLSVSFDAGTSAKGNCWASIWARQHLCKNLILGRKTFLVACSPALTDSYILHFLHSIICTHPFIRLKLPFLKNSGIFQLLCLCLPPLFIGDRWNLAMLSTTDNRGIIEICHAMPSITELLLSEWWSMLSNDISDLKLWIKIFNMQPSWFSSSCNASTA